MTRQPSINQLFISSFLFLVGLFCSLHANQELFRVEILRYLPLFFNTCIFSLLFWNPGKYTTNILLILLMGDIFYHMFPLPDNNPFYIFSLSKNLYFFQIFISFVLLLVCSGCLSDLWIKRLVRWSPLFFLMAVNSLYTVLSFNPIYPHDGARHISNALVVYNQLVSGEPDKLLSSIQYYDFYFPVSYLASFPFFLLFGKSFTAGCLTLSLFWLPLGYHYLWKSLKEQYRFSDFASSLSCFLIFGASMSSSLLRTYMQDFPALVLLIVFQFLVFKSDFFSNRRLSLIAGLVFGIGLVTKGNLFLFGIVPVLFTLYKGWEEKNLFERQANLLIFFFSLSAVAGIWFSVNIFHFSYEIANGAKQYGEQNFPTVTSFDSIIWYTTRLKESLGPFQTILLCCGVVISLVTIRKLPFQIRYALVSFIFFYILITLFRVKDQRTIFPALCLIAPVFAYLTEKLIKIRGAVFFFPIVLLFIIQENICYLTGISYVLPSGILQKPFSMPAGFETPRMEDSNKSHFIYDRFCRSNGLNTSEFPISWPGEYTPFIERYFSNLYPKSETHTNTQNIKQLIFCRDYFWQDYYLFSVSKSDSSLTISPVDNMARIKGDFYLTYSITGPSGEKSKDSLSSFSLDRPLLKIPVPSPGSRLEIALIVHHSHPMGQRVKAYYQFIGKEKYDTFYIPLDVYAVDGSRSSKVEIKF